MSWPVTTRDLAPGDAKSASLDLARFELTRIRSTSDPLFEEAYGRLWQEFGAKDEMEQREVLERRFQLGPRFCYEMALVRRDGEFIAVRDHTAAMTRDNQGTVVHLSHNLVAPAARRTGLAGWLRALPIAAAYECLRANADGVLEGTAPSVPRATSGSDIDGAMPSNSLLENDLESPVTLLAEMEYAQPDDPAGAIRLQAYERAGFRKIDPQVIHFFQPDFRPPDVIDATGSARPLPFQLLVRRVRREQEDTLLGAEVRQLVETLYDIYRPQFRAADLAHPALSLDGYPANDAVISLLPPTQC